MFEVKVWKDRIAEFISRRTLTYEDSTTAVVTVERNEGEVSQTGDAFSAENMNGLEQRIASEFEIVEGGLAPNSVTTFPSDGSIVVTLENGDKVITTFPSDGSIVKTIEDSEGNVLAQRTTTFPADGSIVIQ